MSDFRSDLGEQIMDLVDNALNSDNYDKLSETINRQMNKLFGGNHYQNRPNGTGNNRPGGQGTYRGNGTGQNPYGGYAGGSRPGITHRKSRYFTILVTVPAPTVRPPSRIAKRIFSSRATGAISLTAISTLSPGMTISTPSGS